MRTSDREGAGRAAPRRRGCLRLGCLAKSGLGCGSFLVGAGVVTVALFPAALGSVLTTLYEAEFRERHAGSLDVGEVRFSWFQTQRIEDVTLRDPSGAYVGSAELSLPPLLELFENVDRGALGPVRIDLDASLHAGEDGVWNLARALAPREEEELAARGVPEVGIQRKSRSSNARLDGELDAVVGFWRASWSSPGVRAAGRRQVVVLLDEGRLLVSETGDGRLVARGRLEDERGGGESRPLTLEVEFADLERVLARRERPRRWAWTVEGLPANLLGVLGPGPGLPYEQAFGEHIGSVRLARLPDAGEVYELELRGAGARLDLAGTARDGALVAGSARADFTLAGFWLEEVVLRLLPFLGDLLPAEEQAVARLELTSFSLPLDAALADVTGELRLDLGEVSYVAFPFRADGAAGLASAPATRVPPVLLSLAEGRARLAALRLPVEGGELELAGVIDLATGGLDLTAVTDATVAARALGAPVSSDGPVTLRVRGDARIGVTVTR